MYDSGKAPDSVSLSLLARASVAPGGPYSAANARHERKLARLAREDLPRSASSCAIADRHASHASDVDVSTCAGTPSTTRSFSSGCLLPSPRSSAVSPRRSPAAGTPAGRSLSSACLVSSPRSSAHSPRRCQASSSPGGTISHAARPLTNHHQEQGRARSPLFTARASPGSGARTPSAPTTIALAGYAGQPMLAPTSCASLCVADSQLVKDKKEKAYRTYKSCSLWLERQLEQQIGAYEQEWKNVWREDDIEQRVAAAKQQSSAAMRQKSYEHAQARELREQSAVQKRQVLEQQRYAYLMEKQQWENRVFPQRIAQLREQRQAELSRAGAAYDARQQAVRLRADTAAEELRESRVARARSVDTRKEAIFTEVAHIEQLNVAAQEHIRLGMQSMQKAIQQQRLRSVCDPDALRRYINELKLPALPAVN